jgi:excisionase family DNA binding protein
VRKLWHAPEPARPRLFYSVAEAAEIFGMSDMTLYRAIHEGQFPAVRVRNRLFVPAKAVEAMAEAALSSGGLVDAADWQGGEAT